MIVNLTYVWPAKTNGDVIITIGFITDKEYRDDRMDMVKRVAQKWLNQLPSNVVFSWKAPKAKYSRCKVRISFQASPSSGNWLSKIGTRALDVTDQKTPTTYLKWIGDNKSMERHILHEFGHILGAEHEQFSPVFPWQFKSSVVFEQFEKEVEEENKTRTPRWTSKQVRDRAVQRAYRDMFKRLNTDNIQHSPFDDQSIMLYGMKKTSLSRVDDGEPPRDLKENNSLSYLDTAIMNDVYVYRDHNPYDEEDPDSGSDEDD